jgi:hypothetical protein
MDSLAAAPADHSTFNARPGEAREWDRLLGTVGRSSLEQSWAYGEAVAGLHGAAVTRLIIENNDRPVALAQGFRVRRFKIGSVNRILRGPLWLEDLSGEQQLEVCRTIRRAFRKRVTDLLFWLPELPDTPDAKHFMRSMGMRRMVTGYSTVWLDLRPDEDKLRGGLHGKWRNALVAAEQAGLRVRAAERNRAFEEAMVAYDQFRRKQRFIGPPGDLIRQMHGGAGKAGNVRVWEAFQAKTPVAGIAMARHGASATYLAGWTGAAGRDANAHNLLLWRAITALRQSGTHWLDLGGLDTQTSPGIARFKLGLGGELATLSGTYL